MNTIRSKITFFFASCIAVMCVFAILYYTTVSELKQKLIAIEKFDDIRDNVLELRRYEKNLIYTKDPASFEKSGYYLNRTESAYKKMTDDIVRLVGQSEFEKACVVLQDYKKTLKHVFLQLKQGSGDVDVSEIRDLGKQLVNFTSNLILLKREKINSVLNRIFLMPMVVMGGFILTIALIYRLMLHDVLKPLSRLRVATEKAMIGKFEPIDCKPGRNDEVSRLVAAFNRMANEIGTRQEQLLQSRKMASIGTFTSGIAHELNNPVNNISLIVESLIERKHTMNSDERDQLYNDLMEQADRTSAIVRNLLDFSRQEQRRVEPTSIEEILDKTVLLLKNELKLNRIKFSKQVVGEIPEIQLDRSSFQQVFLNLLVNSIQAMPDGGEIAATLDGRNSKKEIVIEICDTGVGIAEEHIDRIFDPFYTTKREGEGTGLGLSVTYGIIEQHGGKIQVRRRKSRGTCFTIHLPTGGEHAIAQQ